jgi:hypothetical protein
MSNDVMIHAVSTDFPVNVAEAALVKHADI